MELKRKTLALLLSFAMLFSMMPTVAFAGTVGDAESMHTQSISQNRIIISDASALAELGGKDVVGIVELAGDINMDGQTVLPIKSLVGTFEGNGYTISNLNVTEALQYGEGWSKKNVAGLIGKLNGEVRNLVVDNINVTVDDTNNLYVGAITGLVEESTSKIVNCKISGTGTVVGNGASSCVGGVLGSASFSSTVTIENCISDVNVEGPAYVGGLLGDISGGTVDVKNTKVLGNVNRITSNNCGGGGILGKLGPSGITLDTVVYGGTVSGYNTFALAYLTKYGAGTATVTDSVYDIAKNPKIEVVKSDYASKVTGTFKEKNTEEIAAIHDPEWVAGLLADTHTLTVNAEGADKVTITKDGVVTEMSNMAGSFTAQLPSGVYTYSAETSLADKATSNGVIIIGKTDKTVVITMPNKAPDTSINVQPTDAKLSVFMGSTATGQPIEAKSVNDGKYVYALSEGVYTYKAEAEGYTSKTETFNVTMKGEPINVVLDKLPEYEVTFSVTPDRAAVTVMHDGKVCKATDENPLKYRLMPGNYNYTVTAEGYIEASGSFKVTDKAELIEINLKGVSGAGTKENPFKIGSKAELVHFAQQVNNGNKKYADAYVVLTDDVDLENMSWIPIGKNSIDAFRGIFDGKNHTISGINVTNARVYNGFFGCLDNATVKNLTLKGNVYCSEPSSRVGGLAGYAKGNVDIENCVNAMNISAVAKACEGMGGLIGGYEDGVDYKWEDIRLLIKDSYNAGNIICIGSDASATIGGLVGANKNCVQLEDCYNVGKVYGPGVQAAGLLGNAGQQTGDNCKPSMKNCYSAGQVTGAEGKSHALYGKGTIAENNITNCYAEKGVAPEVNKGTTVVADEVARNEMLAELGNKWTSDPSKNNGLPYLAGSEPITSDDALFNEMNKYADVISISAASDIGAEPAILKDGQKADPLISARCSQSSEDISKGYIKIKDGKIVLAKKNQTNSAVTETATLTLSKDDQVLHKPLSIVIYPAAEMGASLMDNIAASYVNSSSEWVIFDMSAYSELSGKTHKTAEAARKNYINLTVNALSDKKYASVIDRAKSEIILSAIGIDTTRLKAYQSETEFNNGAELANMNLNTGIYNAPWILLADERGNVELTKEQIKLQIKNIKESQGSNGLIKTSYMGKKYDDIDTTGTCLAAVARFYFDEEDKYGVKTEVTEFVNKAIEGLKTSQGLDGSFGNINTDAMVIVGLAAIGQNPSEFVKNGCSLADAPMLYANSRGNGFTTAYIGGAQGEKAEALATEQGFRALVVLEKLKDNKVYNIYSGKVQHNDGSGIITPEKPTEPGTSEGSGTLPETEHKPETDPSKPVKNIVASLNVKAADSEYWLPATSMTLVQGSTAADLISKALSSAGMSCKGLENGYITSVTKGNMTLAQFDMGKNSGWMYSVNGEVPQVGINSYELKDRDAVSLYYVKDYTAAPGTGGWTPAPKPDDSKDEDKDKEENPSEELSVAKVKAKLSEMKFAARSVKTKKNNVIVRVRLNKSQRETIKEIEAAGYNVKYHFYRSAVKSKKYQSKLRTEGERYVNTAGKYGKSYYYKARIQVYDAGGKLVAKTALTQCKYASRVWTKKAK